MSWRSDTTQLIASNWVSSAYAGHGITGAAIKAMAIGSNGYGVFANDYDVGDDAKEFRAELLTLPSAGTLTFNEDGTFSLVGAPSGSYSFTYRLWIDGVNMGVATVSMTVGAVASASMSITTDDAVFAGAASATAGAFMSITTDDAVFAGSASVSPRAVMSITTDDAVFAGRAGLNALASMSIVTDDAVFAGSASVAQSSAYPDPSDVRVGVAYGPSMSLVGTLAGGGVANAEEVAAAVWSKVIESGITAEGLIRILVAQAVGNAEGLGTTTLSFSSLDGSKVRIEGTVSNGQRTVNVVDAE